MSNYDDDCDAVYQAGSLIFTAIYGGDPDDDYDLSDREVDAEQKKGYQVLRQLSKLGFLNDKILPPQLVQRFAEAEYKEPTFRV